MINDFEPKLLLSIVDFVLCFVVLYKTALFDLFIVSISVFTCYLEWYSLSRELNRLSAALSIICISERVKILKDLAGMGSVRFLRAEEIRGVVIFLCYLF